MKEFFNQFFWGVSAICVPGYFFHWLLRFERYERDIYELAKTATLPAILWTGAFFVFSGMKMPKPVLLGVFVGTYLLYFLRFYEPYLF